MRTPTPRLSDTSLCELAQLLRNNIITSKHLVQTYLTRIQELNSELHAVIETNPDAVSDAWYLDSQSTKGLLHGLPILLKDNIPTLDRTSTACGSLALLNARPSAEAAIVSSLRNAGAIILGKANMAEWCGFRSTSGCSGWSARGGQGTGVYWSGMKASGSSGGCAVAVSLGLCAAAIGTELDLLTIEWTCWSIVSPAERSGIIGFKPSRNMISSEGIIHASRRLDTVGVLTRNVEDAAALVREIVKNSEHRDDPTRIKLYNSIDPLILTDSLNGVCIGIPSHLAEFQCLDPMRRIAFKAAQNALAEAGANIVEGIHVAGAREYDQLTQREKDMILDTELKDAINTYLSSLATNPQNITDLASLIEFTKSHPTEGYPDRNVARLERANTTSIRDLSYLEMRKKEMFFNDEGGIDGALKRHECDVLIVPGINPKLQTFAAAAGSPVISVPIGKYGDETEVRLDAGNGLVDVAPGLPISAFIFGKFRDDTYVLRVAHVLERMLRVRKDLLPYLEPRTELQRVLRTEQRR